MYVFHHMDTPVKYSIKIVIARYKENVDWANGLTNELETTQTRVVLYNKSDTPCATSHTVISLPNVGREGHTYAYHMMTHYDDLDDYTVFLQGYPFDHSPYLEQQLRDICHRIAQGTQPDFEYLSSQVLFSNLARCPYDITLNMYPSYEKIFGIAGPQGHPFLFGAGAQFVVSKDAIQSRARTFYQNLCKVLDYDVNPVEGFCVERFWNMIFTHTESRALQETHPSH